MLKFRRRVTVIRPCAPTVAINANASMTPPNCASTLQAEFTSDRITPPGREPIRAKHRIAPDTAPTSAVTPDSTSDPPKARRMVGSARPVRLFQVNSPESSKNPVPTATTVGQKAMMTIAFCALGRYRWRKLRGGRNVRHYPTAFAHIEFSSVPASAACVPVNVEGELSFPG